MIVDDRFPTTYSDTSYPLYEYERTNLITSLGDGFKNYWLGYMTYDVIPSVFFASELSTSTNGISAKPVNSQQNSPVGYTTDNYGYAAYQSAYIKETGFTPANSYNCYLNSMHARAYGTEFSFTTGNDSACQLVIMIETGSDESLGTHQSLVTKVLSGDDATTTGLITFLQGQRDMTLTHTINGATVTHILKSEELENNGIVEFTGVANGTYYKLSVFIAGYGFTPAAAHDSSETHNRIYHIAPTLKMFSEYGNYYVIRTHGAYAPSYTRVDVNTGAFNLSGNTGNIAGIGLLGGFDFSFKLADLQALAMYDFIYNGNTVAYKLSGVAQLFRVYKPSDVLHHFALIMRIPSGLSYGYIPGVYCPEVLDDGQFTGNLLTGTLSEDDVQPWQWGNITTDDFKESDIPPYTPSGEGDDAFSGEEFAPIINYRMGTAAGFITLYALTDNQLAAFGSALWSTPAQDAFWQSIGVMLTTDLSIDPAHVLDYIVSIRKYPLNLANLDIFNTGTPGIYLGRGISGISVGGNVGYLDSYSCDVYGGSEKVPTEFNDFRDYEPYTKVSLYVPFCGTVELTPSQVVGKDLILQYVIDFSNGVIQANVIVSGEKGLVTLAVLSGKIGADVQATADNQIGQLQKISSIGHSIASTGIKMVAASQAGDSARTNVIDTTGAVAVSGQNSIMGSFLSSVMSHNLNSNEGFSSFSMLTPCIFVERKHFNVPSNYGHTHGYACNVTTTLGDLEGKGFTVCGNVDLTGIPATQDELAALEALLQSGVYL